MSVVVCLLAITVWLIYTLRHAPQTLGVFLFFMLMAILSQSVIQRLCR